MRRKDVEDCEYLTIYLFINKVHCGLKICHFNVINSEVFVFYLLGKGASVHKLLSRMKRLSSGLSLSIFAAVVVGFL